MSGLLLTWNCQDTNVIYENRKVTKELLNGLESDNELSFKIVNSEVTCEDPEFTSLIEQLFKDGLIPDNCDCTIFHIGEGLNVIGDFLSGVHLSEINPEIMNDIDYFIDII